MSRFQFVDDHSKTYTVKRLCRVLGLHRSSFYKWRASGPTRRRRRQADEALVARMRDYHLRLGGRFRRHQEPGAPTHHRWVEAADFQA